MRSKICALTVMQVVLMLVFASPGHAQTPTNTYPWPADGPVGIGNPTPGAKLEVKDGVSGAVNTIVKLNSGFTSTGTGEFINTGLGVLFGSVIEAGFYPSPAFEVRGTTGSPRFWVATSGLLAGRVGIGTTAPNAALDINAASDVVPLKLQGGLETLVNDYTNQVFYTPIQKMNLGDGAIQFTSSSKRYLLGTDNDNGGHLFFWTLPPTGIVGNASMVLQTDGNLAIGLPSATEKLAVGGKIKIPDVEGINIILGYTNAAPIPSSKLIQAGTGVTFGGVRTGAVPANRSFQVMDDGSNVKLYVGTEGPYDGNVGIGTLTPTEKLEVNGTMKAKEVRVTLDGWPDHVFQPGYDLMPLDALAAAIRQQGHLPGIPAGQEVATSGLSVGEMQAKLLEKVEELTLYVINLNKENAVLRSEVAALAQQGRNERPGR